MYAVVLEEMGDGVRYRWISVLDSRTTDVCRGRSNKVYEVGVGPIPPAHPNCRCSTELTVETVEEARARGEQAQEERRRVLEELGLL